MPFSPDGGGGGGGGGRGGSGGGGSKGTVSSFVPFLENGGFAATAYYLFVPAQASSGGNAYIGAFSASNYNDVQDASFYFWRQEDIIVGRVPTIRRLILLYRDLGVATITIGVQGVDDNNAQQISQQQVTIGTTAATGLICTKLVDTQLTAYRPQAFLLRAANAGPVSIVSLTMVGEVEDVSL
jgi:hypothetical protein